MQNALTLGLLSDTHLPYRLKRIPQAALDALSGVDLILHAGDVDDPAALAPLRAIAPVHAVRGNWHLQDLSDGGASLPLLIELDLMDHRVLVTHGHRPGLLGFLEKGINLTACWLKLTHNGKFNHAIAHRLSQRYPHADVIVFGHTHRAYVRQIGRQLLINPGGVCPTRAERPTVARLRLASGTHQVEIIPLDGMFEHKRNTNKFFWFFGISHGRGERLATNCTN
ncbi:MAG TPA: metallophosphoesterase [Chloroflexi bacterium]|nr:metallophosphoesterase [Chloroflexota bacterium]